MAISYIEAIDLGFPGTEVHCIGDPYIYENIRWDKGIAGIPTKEMLDTWIANNKDANSLLKPITKLQFRQLFTFMERVTIDNIEFNPNFPGFVKGAVNTMLKDLSMAEEINLTHPEIISGVNMLEQFGVIAQGRAAQILAKQYPEA